MLKTLELIQDMYDSTTKRVKMVCGEMELVPVKVELHQGSTLSPYLFVLVTNSLKFGI